jgi:hypothetical protein
MLPYREAKDDLPSNSNNGNEASKFILIFKDKTSPKMITQCSIQS